MKVHIYIIIALINFCSCAPKKIVPSPMNKSIFVYYDGLNASRNMVKSNTNLRIEYNFHFLKDGFSSKLVYKKFKDFNAEINQQSTSSFKVDKDFVKRNIAHIYTYGHLQEMGDDKRIKLFEMNQIYLIDGLDLDDNFLTVRQVFLERIGVF